MKKMNNKDINANPATYITDSGTLTVNPTSLVVSVHNGITPGGNPVSLNETRYTSSQLSALAVAGSLVPNTTYVASDTLSRYWASTAYVLVPSEAVEVSAYTTLTATGLAAFGLTEFAGWYCSVAAGTITVYDAISVTGTPIVPATTLTVGPAPIFGPGTNGKLILNVGCYVVLSGAATVRMLVQGAG